MSRRRVFATCGLQLAAGAPVLAIAAGIANAAPPPIRIIDQGPGSRVPACVTPERLMAYLITRNPKLDPRYRDIAHLYKQHGEAWRVRWDYAFFQMVVETNGLIFRRGDGKSGDVNPNQFNFAGLGTTGGGVPGDAYRDASTGVLAQIQHLVVYSGERIEQPIGSRTRLAQNDILSASASVSRKRAVTFQDLSGRWAADRAYGRTIESVAERYRQMFCTGREPDPSLEARAQPLLPPIVAPTPRLATRPTRTSDMSGLGGPPINDEFPPRPEPRQAVQIAAVRPAAVAPRADSGMTAPRPIVMAEIDSGASSCRVQTASFGGRKAILVRAIVNGQQQLTALQVLDGFEASMFDSYTRSYAPGATVIGEFASTEGALERARQMCAPQAPRLQTMR